MKERPTRDAPRAGSRRPPRAPWCRPHSAQSQLARARAVGLMTGPHAHIPRTHSQWVVGPGRTPQGRALGRERSLKPGCPSPGKRPPTRAPSCGSTARKASSQERTLWDWWRVPTPTTPCTHRQWVAGPGGTPQGQEVGPGRAPNPGSPDAGKRRLPGRPCTAPERAKQARNSAPCGNGGGSPRTHPPHPQAVGSRSRPHALRTGGWARESAQPRRPHTLARGAPPAGTFLPPHSGQGHLTRACAVELMTGPHAHKPRTHSEWVVDPGRRPQGRAVGRGRAPNGGCLTARQETLPQQAPLCAPTARKAASQERALRSW